MEDHFYSIKAKKISGEEVSLEEFRGKIVLIVNTASHCGFTPQYKGLEELYQKFKDQGFVILGFPCNQFGKQEPGDEKEIMGFCEINYGVTFPLFAKVEVNGKNAHPLFTYLQESLPGLLGSTKIKWNFTKFLIDQKGIPVKRYAPTTEPSAIADDIETLLKHL